MSFRQSKIFWLSLATSLPLITAGIYYGIKTMTSIYNKDLGNGVVIYADDYVKTGKWVFDCKYRRLISRIPLPAPLDELKSTEKFTTRNMYTLSGTEKKTAKELIEKTTKSPNWYRDLKYLYSVLNDYSDIDSHVFYLITSHSGIAWAIEVDQSIEHDGKSEFKISATPYNPETYVDYAKALQAAVKSCPAPQ